MLSDDERSTLLGLARQAVRLAAAAAPLGPLPPGELPSSLRSPGCAFVTLTRDGALRGCIGGLEAVGPLAEDVWRHAYAAAREDPRFPPVTLGEVDLLRLEVSCLTAPTRLNAPPEEIPARLRPGIDGVILQRGLRRATFLPQVWEKIPQAEPFLDLLAEKAGLPRSDWRRGEAEVLTYQVESFEEG